MSTTMHDLLAAALEVRERSLEQDSAFLDGHGTPVRRSIRVRRLGTYAGTGAVAVVATVGAGMGLHAWAGSDATLAPGGSATPRSDDAQSPNLHWTGPNLAAQVTVDLVQVPLDESIYSPDEPSRSYVYYATLGQSEMVPFPGGGLYYPGIPDVPADAFVVVVSGDVDGYDLDGPGGFPNDIGAFAVPSDEGDLVGDRSNYRFEYTADGQNASITWDVFGHVSSTTQWGVHYFLVDGRLVTELEGRAKPEAIEVTATFTPTITN